MTTADRFLLAGVMGWPVMHSRSPLLHNYWLRRHGLAGAYVPLAIKPDGLVAALRALPALGFSGVNLTIPHKQAALAVVDEIDPVAKRVGAINCVTVRLDGSLAGTNNDAFGFVESVVEAYPDWRVGTGPIIVAGAGGGARAVVFGLAQKGAREIRVVNRTFDWAKGIERDFGSPAKAVDWSERNDALEGAAMLVNTTSQGMAGEPPLDIRLDRLPTTALVVDIVYIPRETPLVAAARARGNPALNGLGMLLHQARPAWKSWFGIEPQVTPELRGLLEATL